MISTLKAKQYILRVDMNQPVNKDTEELEDITRIKGCAPTVKELSDKGAKLVVLAHQGSDIEYKNYHNLKPHAKVLGDLIGKTVMHISDICGAYAQMRIRELNDGEILLLDNVRFMAEEMTLFETNLEADTRSRWPKHRLLKSWRRSRISTSAMRSRPHTVPSRRWSGSSRCCRPAWAVCSRRNMASSATSLRNRSARAYSCWAARRSRTRF